MHGNINEIKCRNKCRGSVLIKWKLTCSELGFEKIFVDRQLFNLLLECEACQKFLEELFSIYGNLF